MTTASYSVLLLPHPKPFGEASAQALPFSRISQGALKLPFLSYQHTAGFHAEVEKGGQLPTSKSGFVILLIWIFGAETLMEI